MLFLAVVVVLFIACANLAGLLLVRVIGSRREISVRFALGASRTAVLRQSLVEALVLSVCGGLLGLALAWVAMRIGVSFLPESLPRVNAIRPRLASGCFRVSLALLTGLLCGLVPAFAAARTRSTRLSRKVDAPAQREAAMRACVRPWWLLNSPLRWCCSRPPAFCCAVSRRCVRSISASVPITL